ncbi:MAG: hypothetical protein ACRDVE_02440, partial [Actinocrinis sp.]
GGELGMVRGPWRGTRCGAVVLLWRGAVVPWCGRAVFARWCGAPAAGFCRTRPGGRKCRQALIRLAPRHIILSRLMRDAAGPRGQDTHPAA